ncbi:MAG: CRTAC1 family protein [Pseudomonadota bacterium]
MNTTTRWCVAAAATLAFGGPHASERVQFSDASASSGLTSFQHFSYGFGGDGLAGAAWFDYNNDGLLDLYLTNGKDATGEVAGRVGFDNALFENQGDGTFLNVAAVKGVTSGAGDSGAIAADIDNDGDQDLFLTGDGGMLGEDPLTGIQTVDTGVRLYINQGAPDYAFVEADNEAVGLTGFETTMSAAFGDIDSDGRLDLFVTASGTRGIGCSPPNGCFDDDPTIQLHKSRLYLNRSADGEIRFRDITDASIIGDTQYGALATAFSDYDRDGRMDLFVVNGVLTTFGPTPVQLYHNRGIDAVGRTVLFDDITNEVGLEAQSAWMCIAGADFDGDLGIDWFITNTGNSQRPHALYHWSQRQGRYNDVAELTQLNGPSPSPADYFGWGAVGEDFDLDGRADLFFGGSPPPLEGTGPNNPGVLLMNDPPTPLFVDYTADTTVDMSDWYTSGVAAADYDNDGRVDILVATDSWDGDGRSAQLTGTPVLLRNETVNDNAWITLRLQGNGIDTNRDAVGARVLLIVGEPPNRTIQVREIYAGSSFLSMDSPWMTFGLGDIEPGTRILAAIDWPNGPQTAGNIWDVRGPLTPNQIVDIVQD